MDIEVGDMQQKLFGYTKNLLAICIDYAKHVFLVNKSFDKKRSSDRLNTFNCSLTCTISLLPGFSCSWN